MIQPRPHLRGVVRLSKKTPRNALRLHRNERPEPFDAEVFGEIKSTFEAEDLCFYPDENLLIERLSELLSVPRDMVSISSGSDAAIRRTFHAFVEPGEVVAYCKPSYAMYEVYSKIHQAKTLVLNYGPNRTMPIERYSELLNEAPRLLIISNPDQPTGAALNTEELETILIAAERAGTLVLVDEAYFPFHNVTAVPLVPRFSNLIVTRTFSKIFGLAGLRVGFAVGSEILMTALESVKGASEVTSLGIKAACWLLDNPDVVNSYHTELESGRRVLLDYAVRKGWSAPDCPANFQLLGLPGNVDIKAFVREVAARDIVIKGEGSHPSVEGHVRVTLCGPETMGLVVEAFDAALNTGSR
jgi:histidinol-phosphate aminotransferase